MVSTSHKYDKNLILETQAMNEALSLAETLMRQIYQHTSSQFNRSKGYVTKVSQAKQGDIRLNIARRNCIIDMSLFVGQNMKIVDGQEKKYFSLSIKAHCQIPSVERAKTASGELTFWFRIGGAVVSIALLGFGIQWLSSPDEIHIPGAGIIAAAVILGGSIGYKLGEVIGSVVTGLVVSRTSRDREVLICLEDWDVFLKRIEEVMDAHNKTPAIVT
jgi:hypothetical protein